LYLALREEKRRKAMTFMFVQMFSLLIPGLTWRRKHLTVNIDLQFVEQWFDF